MGFRVGIGHDTHRLGASRPLVIGGVQIADAPGLVGHSDADVLLHAITDAILGAMGAGDIGEWFPDTDPANRDRDSGEMLRVVCRQCLAPPARLVHLDCILFVEQPKFSPYKESIRARVAELLGVPAARINIKAKTGEKVGPIGRGECISAQAVVLLDTGVPD